MCITMYLPVAPTLATRLMLYRRSRHTGPRLLVVVTRVMHAQQVHAVVAAVGRAHNGVNVEFGRQLVGEEHAGVMIELDHHHRALNPVVESVVLAGAADPAKMRGVEMALDFFDARGARAFGQRLNVGVDKIEQLFALRLREAGYRRAFVRHDAIVLKRAAQMQLVSAMAARGGQVAAGGGMKQDGLFALCV